MDAIKQLDPRSIEKAVETHRGLTGKSYSCQIVTFDIDTNEFAILLNEWSSETERERTFIVCDDGGFLRAITPGVMDKLRARYDELKEMFWSQTLALTGRK